MLYWFGARQNLKLQNVIVVLSSYVFYGWWDWRFLSLIFVSTLVDYAVGIGLKNSSYQHRRNILLFISLSVNLGLLGFFKYYNFFLDNFVSAFSLLGTNIQAQSLNIILPVGISFYTFQTLSYTIDVYRRKLEPTRDFMAFAAYVSFFPQLVAGPIERATQLLPQFFKKRTFDYSKAVDGLRQILWGLFKKVVIADNCAEFANLIFSDPGGHSGSTLVLGAVFFAFQIYGDFSGYSDIAIGTSRLFGFSLMRNFNNPYFSRDIAEFWRRWHISLSTWFRDYLYIPLGGSRGSLWTKIRNVLIVFIVSGFWHGANWTFIIWGTINALLFIPLLLSAKNRTHLDTVSSGRLLPSAKEAAQMLLTFTLTTFAWIFFRAENVSNAFEYLDGIFSSSIFDLPKFQAMSSAVPIIAVTLIFVIIEWFGREGQYALDHLVKKWSSPVRYGVYYSLVIAIFWYAGKEQAFIYFQF